jgi:hypothetical protein
VVRQCDLRSPRLDDEVLRWRVMKPG